MRKVTQSAEPSKGKAPAESKYDPAKMLTALEDILLTIGDANTETEHRVKLIAERAIAKARKR